MKCLSKIQLLSLRSSRSPVAYKVSKEIAASPVRAQRPQLRGWGAQQKGERPRYRASVSLLPRGRLAPPEEAVIRLGTQDVGEHSR